MSAKNFRKNYYTSPTGESYLFTAEDLLERGPNGEASRARLYRSSDSGKTWLEMPLELSWRSRVAGRILTSWPPENIDAVEVRDGVLCIAFHDREDTYERSPLPFRWGDEAMWRARLLPSGKWRLERIRYLDYDGADRDLKWAGTDERED